MTANGNPMPVPNDRPTLEQVMHLCQYAAAEIDRLRLELSVQQACMVAGREEIARLRLTDAEREAVEASMHGENNVTVIATLRNLLERMQ